MGIINAARNCLHNSSNIKLALTLMFHHTTRNFVFKFLVNKDFFPFLVKCFTESISQTFRYIQSPQSKLMLSLVWRLRILILNSVRKYLELLSHLLIPWQPFSVLHFFSKGQQAKKEVRALRPTPRTK